MKFKLFDYSKITNVRIAGIDPTDHPKYTDAYVESAGYDGKPMDEDQLDELTSDSDFPLHDYAYQQQIQ